jgi:hypothetical protein
MQRIRANKNGKMWRKQFMFGAIRSDVITRMTLAVSAGVLFAAVLILMPVSVGAQCANWDANVKQILIWQTGLGPGILLDLQHRGTIISGTATNNFAYDGRSGAFGKEKKHKTVNGTIEGTIGGDNLNFQIFWPEGLTGVYAAKILPSGRLEGETYDKSRPGVRQTWRSDNFIRCAPVVASPPARTGPPKSTGKAKPVKSTGKAKPSSTTVSKPEPMKVPGIVASQVIFPQPNAAMGFTILTWDAGPDHTYAEMWVKVNNGDEQFVVELGKGSRQVTVERGKYYTYILTDAGKTLATVNVVGN